MRRLFGVIAVLALVVSACGDSGSGGCAGVADDGIKLIQEVLDEVSNLSFDDLSALGDEPPPALSDLETRGEELQAKADDLGCTDTEMRDLINDRIGDLEADGPFGELILEGIRSEGLFN